ncbi:MAG: DUF1595 domain-containing protein [Vicinamibacterales bacterium]
MQEVQALSKHWTRRFTPLVVGALVVVGGARAASPPAESFFPDGIRRLTAQQYYRTIADVFGDDLEVASLAQSPDRFEQSDWMAQGIAAQVVDTGHRAALVGCTPRDVRQPDDGCATTFFRRTGRLLFRRPLSEGDLKAYVVAASEATRLTKNFHSGLALSLASMLASPKFLYDVDILEPDPARPGTQRLDAYSKAARVSLFLWNAAPDIDLLDAAARGALHTPSGLASEVDRLLTSPRLAAGELASRFGQEGAPLRALLRDTVTNVTFLHVSPASRAAPRENER